MFENYTKEEFDQKIKELEKDLQRQLNNLVIKDILVNASLVTLTFAVGFGILYAVNKLDGSFLKK